MVSQSWPLYGDELGTGRPSLAPEPPVSRAGDDLVLSAAGLLETVLGLALTRPGTMTKGK
ncbi:hypothetical protein [Streptomyces sp. NPDC058252]|uniref:hypothetical protein n=1 Tax=unclassified Streptomyces TaxID=2593676 RepID=UPI0036E6788B